MEQNSFIEITVSGKTENGYLRPTDIDIAETKEMLTDAEALLFPTKSEREERPKVSYQVNEGSVKNIFFVPAANVIMFSALMTEVGRQGTAEILQPKAIAVLDKWQKKAYSSGKEYAISSSISPGPFLQINKESKFIAPQTEWINTSLYVYGEIFEEGGLSKSNLHILTDRYGRLMVDATKEQLTEGANKLYNIYGLWVKGKQSIESGALRDLSLIDFLTYSQDYDDVVLNQLIEKATVSWSKIKDKDSWLQEVRGSYE